MPTNDEKRRQDYLESKESENNKQSVHACGPSDPDAMPENLCNVQDIEE